MLGILTRTAVPLTRSRAGLAVLRQGSLRALGRPSSLRLMHSQIPLRNKKEPIDRDMDEKDMQFIRDEIEKYVKSAGVQKKDMDKEERKRIIEEGIRQLEQTVKRQKAATDAREDQESSANKTQESSAKEKQEASSKSTDGSGPRGPTSNGPFSPNSQPPPGMPPVKTINFFQLAVFFFLLSLLMDMFAANGASREISWQEFHNDFLSKGYVAKLVIVNKSLVRVMLNDSGKAHAPMGTDYFYFSVGSIENFERKLKKAQDELGIDENFRVPVLYTQEGNWGHTVMQVMPTVLMIAGIVWLTSRSAQAAGGGARNSMFGMGKSKAQKFNIETDVKIKFKDVAGCDEAKEEIMEFVSFLKEPSRYEKMGAKIPRGAILSGPPGTGKTLLAKATAGEAGVPFYFVSGSEFVEMFVGVGAARVRDLFKTARENAPSIIFIDEIDAIGKARQKGNFSGANDERENTLNQMLVEMDGFTPADHVVILAGTNRPDILDKALLRPGRFDRHINIDKPELEGRKAIFAVHLAKLKLANDVFDLKNRLAALTPGFSGADIANVCNEAALIAARGDEHAVHLKDFEQAIERVIGGVERKSKVLSMEEKRVVAYHEAGHAVCGWYLKYADPLLKVSIIPRGQGALGYAQYLPGDIFLLSEQQLRDRMTMSLGGRVSEELHFSSVTSGASDDFKKVTNMATAMVTQLGMSPKIGWINYQKKDDSDMTKPFSDETGDIIDAEVHRIVQECRDRCAALLKEKADDVEKIAQLLLKKEVLTREDMINLLGKRPFPERNDAFDKYLNDKDSKPAEPKKEDGEPTPA